MFGETIDAKVPTSEKVCVPKAGSQWITGVYLGKDPEADEATLGNARGVLKRKSPSQQWNATGVMKNDLDALATLEMEWSLLRVSCHMLWE